MEYLATLIFKVPIHTLERILIESTLSKILVPVISKDSLKGTLAKDSLNKLTFQDSQHIKQATLPNHLQDILKQLGNMSTPLTHKLLMQQLIEE